MRWDACQLSYSPQVDGSPRAAAEVGELEKLRRRARSRFYLSAPDVRLIEILLCYSLEDFSGCFEILPWWNLRSRSAGNVDRL